MKCEECQHAVFDETWGEYKCKVRHLRVYKPGRTVKCEWFRKKSIIQPKNEQEMSNLKTTYEQYTDYVYDIVRLDCENMDAIYGDYIKQMVGFYGLNALLSNKVVVL